MYYELQSDSDTLSEMKDVVNVANMLPAKSKLLYKKTWYRWSHR